MHVPKLVARRRAVSDSRRPVTRDVASVAEAGLRVGRRGEGGVMANGGGRVLTFSVFWKKKKRERGKY